MTNTARGAQHKLFADSTYLTESDRRQKYSCLPLRLFLYLDNVLCSFDYPASKRGTNQRCESWRAMDGLAKLMDSTPDGNAKARILQHRPRRGPLCVKQRSASLRGPKSLLYGMRNNTSPLICSRYLSSRVAHRCCFLSPPKLTIPPYIMSERHAAQDSFHEC